MKTETELTSRKQLLEPGTILTHLPTTQFDKLQVHIWADDKAHEAMTP